MLTKDLVKRIVNAQIKKDEKLGQQVGGSGHSGYISYTINQIKEPISVQYEEKTVWKITYTYIINIETEFTYYPDNPPTEYKFLKSILVDNNGEIIKDYEKRSVGGTRDIFEMNFNNIGEK